MHNSEFPRVLVISLNAFSVGNSNNGKVLSQYFCNWDKSCIAQLYMMNEMPDSPYCDNYYRVTDKEALKAFLTGKRVGRRIAPTASEKQRYSTESTLERSTVKKSGITRLLRDVVWNSGRWESSELYEWIDEFSPEVILVMVGGSSFIPNIAMRIAKKRNIPIVVYNTESYYFDTVKAFHVASAIYRNGARRALRKLVELSSHQIYLNDVLNELYSKELGKSGSVIYQSTEYVKDNEKKESDRTVFSYVGNVFLHREDSLIEIAEALSDISPDYVLDVYGGTNSDEVTEKLRACPAINYHGKVPYSTVKKVISESDFLFHAESFKPETVETLRTAFTTKIGDSLASGKPFIVYAHESLACARYLKKWDCAAVITDRGELRERLREIISSEELQKYYVEKALATAQLNHNAERNCERMREILAGAVKGNNENLSD